MIPRDLTEWNYERIKDLASKGYLETDTFEFKPAIRSRDNSLDNRIKETVCAFANTNGGFLIFGVLDMGNMEGDRIVGVDKSDDLAKDFGDKLGSLNPVPYYDFKNPPIEIPHKNTVLFVVHIPKSVDRPHMKTDVARFYLRSNKGNMHMTYEEVESFLRYEGRRTKLKLLYIEVLSNYIIAKEVARQTKEVTPDDSEFVSISVYTFDTTTMNSVLPDIYGIVHESTDLVQCMLRLRIQLNVLNTLISSGPFRISLQHQRSKEASMVNRNLNEHLEKYTLPLFRRIISHMKNTYELSDPIENAEFKIFEEKP